MGNVRVQRRHTRKHHQVQVDDMTEKGSHGELAV
jgi:hypothetical protein